MRRFLDSRIVLLLALGSLLPLYSAHADLPLTLDVGRALEPVVLNGASLPWLIDAATSAIFVYAYDAGEWRRIPFQVDERRHDGQLVAEEDGVFDTNDEVVFMAKDLGESSGGIPPTENGQPVSPQWHEVEVVDPLQPATKGYAYVARSSRIAAGFADGYINFDAANHRVIGQTYTLGYSLSPPNPGDGPQPELWFDYLSLGDDTDILDRMPKLIGCLGGACVSEQYLFGLTGGAGGLAVVKQGPVRLTLRSDINTLIATEILAYGSSVAWSISVYSPIIAPTYLRLSTDFNVAATGAAFYNAVTPADGVIIDGSPDPIPATPFSPWWQTSAANGTLINVVADLTRVGGVPENYYVDDETLCSGAGCDTGDMRHYGEAGVALTCPKQNECPKQIFTYSFNQYFLAGRQPNVGAAYQQYFSNPLLTTVYRRGEEPQTRVLLPMVVRE